MIFVDTNIFLYAADRSSPEHQVCTAFLQKCAAEALPWYTSWNVIYEFLRVATHSKVFAKPLTLTQAWQFMATLLQLENFIPLCPQESHATILQELTHLYPTLSGNILHDLANVALLREHGIKTICTCDMDYHRFEFLDVIYPAKSLSAS